MPKMSGSSADCVTQYDVPKMQRAAIQRRSIGDDLATVLVPGGTVVHVPTSRLDGPESVVRVGVRPEKIRLERDQGEVPSGWNAVSGTLRVSTFIGVSHQYTVDGPGGRTLTVYAQNLGGDDVPSSGEAVRLVWRPEHTFAVKPSEPLADWEEEQ